MFKTPPETEWIVWKWQWKCILQCHNINLNVMNTKISLHLILPFSSHPSVLGHLQANIFLRYVSCVTIWNLILLKIESSLIYSYYHNISTLGSSCFRNQTWKCLVNISLYNQQYFTLQQWFSSAMFHSFWSLLQWQFFYLFLSCCNQLHPVFFM